MKSADRAEAIMGSIALPHTHIRHEMAARSITSLEETSRGLNAVLEPLK
jgi:hypothetical protein